MSIAIHTHHTYGELCRTGQIQVLFCARRLSATLKKMCWQTTYKGNCSGEQFQNEYH